MPNSSKMELDDSKTDKEVDPDDSTKAAREDNGLIDSGSKAEDEVVVVDQNDGPINDVNGVDPNNDDNLDPNDGVDPTCAQDNDSVGVCLFPSEEVEMAAMIMKESYHNPQAVMHIPQITEIFLV